MQDAPKYPGLTDIFVNMVTSPHHLSATMVTGRTHRMTEVFARLAPGATLEQARGEIDRISSNVYRDYPETYEKAAGYNITVTPLREIMNERATLTFWLLMGAATFVFLIACANVANLTLIRGIRRERELIVRRAMGGALDCASCPGRESDIGGLAARWDSSSPTPDLVCSSRSLSN